MKLGDRVSWESQSGGCWTEKTGMVIAEIPAGEGARQHVPITAKRSHIKFDVNKAKIDRVLVAVLAGKDGQITHYYCPRKNVLTTQNVE